MDVILIPFFLAANVVVNDTSEWTYGPEYLYNVTYVMKSAKPDDKMQRISAMKCRPMVAENSLLCILGNTTTIVSMEKDNTFCKQMFEIKFNEYGVESVLIEPPSCSEIVDTKWRYSIIQNIAKQLSVSPDMKRKIGMSHFTAKSRENTSRGNCATMYRITREKLPETLETHDVTAGADFQLVVLPIADARPSTTLTIEKSKMDCINSPSSNWNSSRFFKMERFFRKIYVDGMRGFETYIEMDAKLRTEYFSSGITTFNGLLSLDSIVPAQDPLPSISNGELIVLNSNDTLNNIY